MSCVACDLTGNYHSRQAILSATYLLFAQGVGYGLGFINNGSGIYIFTNMSPSASLIENSNYIQGVQMLP